MLTVGQPEYLAVLCRWRGARRGSPASVLARQRGLGPRHARQGVDRVLTDQAARRRLHRAGHLDRPHQCVERRLDELERRPRRCALAKSASPSW